MPLTADIDRYLHALFADAEPGGLVELRWRHAEGMRRRFVAVGRLAATAAHALGLCERTDVYVGVLPRARRAGGRDALAGHGHVVWVDVDQPDAPKRLAAGAPAPSVLIASGTAGHAHAYWLLDAPTPIAAIDQANRRLARALGADEGAVTNAATILRLPGRHHGHRPPAPVTLEVCAPERRYTLEDLLAGLPALPANAKARAGRTTRRPVGSDALRGMAPAVYVERLAGLRPGRSGKVRCPFHPDQRPSLHVYPTPERGWYCFGCGRGGGVYEFAGRLWDRPLRGRGFGELRRDLQAVLLDQGSTRDQAPERATVV